MCTKTKINTHKTHIDGVKKFAVAAASVLSLIACGGSNKEEIPTSPPEINLIVAKNSPLQQASAQQVERFIKNGVYATSLSSSAVATPNLNSDAGASSEGYSQTNTVEQGVDESDRIKYDGNYMYVAEIAANYQADPSQAKVKVLKRNNDFTLTAMPKIASSLAFDRVEGLYLHDNKLAMIGTNDFYYTLDALNIMPSFPTEQKISVSIFDVSDPAQASETSALEIDGAILASRRIDNDLYIISGYLPSVQSLQLNPASDAEKLANYARVSNTPISQLMPQLYQDGQQSSLNSPEDCYIPEQVIASDGYAKFLNVTKINLAAPSDIQSICLSTVASSLYMSSNNLYLSATVDGLETIFHKINLATFDYAATGSVEGQIGWRGNPLFRVHENDDKLRVVTSNYSSPEPTHNLYVLEQQGSVLSTIATLPNNNAPEAIGKPGEDIYAVRFIDDKAYVVTFERIDPLYVINLSDPSAPFIEGSLEIPGFSSYIHPLDNNYLLGIGQEVTLDELPVTGTEVSITVVPPSVGMKVSLFDVNDPANPAEIASIVVPQGFTPIEYNYKALSVLNNNGLYQFALPLEEWAEVQSETAGQNYFTHKNSLMLLQADTMASLPNLDLIQSLQVPESNEFYFYAGEDRSIIHGNNVYYLRGDEVWLSDWAGTNAPIGPF